MPPTRNLPPLPAKPIKIERTHEENQERAYIAASRRSDRSLEARVESARRASEIHKNRTGRSLRVTEQDVINEEMYEEEDDDLPAQYRRLTAHLQTGSPDFNRRLAAYLTNTVAMRSALEDAVNNSFNEAFPNAPVYAHSIAQTKSLPPFLRSAEVKQSMRQFDAQRGSPYPAYGSPGYRASSIKSASYYQPRADKKISTGSPAIQTSRRASTSLASPHFETMPSPPGPPSAVPSPASDQPLFQMPHVVPSNVAPLTTQLPPEAQQLLAAPSMANKSPAAERTVQVTTSQVFQPVKDELDYSNMIFPRAQGIGLYSGMSTTLAPSMLNTDLANSYPQNMAVHSAPPEIGFSFGNALFSPDMPRLNEQESMKHDEDFSDFVNGDFWE